MNIAAYRNFDPANPTASRFVDEDFNRLWTAAVLDDPARQSAELTRARLLRPYIDTVDLLLDIHSMQRQQPPMMMAGPLAKGPALDKAVALPAIGVTDSGHAPDQRPDDKTGAAEPTP